MASELRVNTITSTTGVGTVTLGSGGVSFSGTPTFNDVTLSSINGNAISGTRNRIINGSMEIDQRNAGASVALSIFTTSGYVVDRWSATVTPTAFVAVQRIADAPVGFSSSLSYTVTATKTPAASDAHFINQNIEGQNIIDFAYGTASPKTSTLSFWVKSSLTGTFSGSLRQQTVASVYRSYVFDYTINSTNTWEYKTITISGDTGQVPAQNNTTGITVFFNLGAGSTFQTSTLNSWVSGNFIASPSALNIISTNGAAFRLTGVQLELGSVATPFERRFIGQELALCYRYYRRYNSTGTTWTALGIGVGGGAASVSRWGFNLDVPMRTTAVPSFTNCVGWNGTVGGAISLNTNYSSTNFVDADLNTSGMNATVGYAAKILMATNGYVEISAEL